MQKLRLFLILLLSSFSVLAQQKTKIELLDFKRNKVVPGENATYFFKPVFKHDNAILSADSAVLYTERNVFEAFNNVHINQADTVNIFSTFLTYDGNAKKAHLSENVRMVDKQSVLTTNVLDYDMANKIGTYVNGGKIVSKDVTLTSTNGYYFSNTKDAYFRYNVVVVTPSATIKSDTLRYNTFTNWSYFYGPTNIKGKDDNLYTENGAYNTKSEYAYFGKKNLYTQGSKSLKGDSLYYNGKTGYGRAVRNIVFKDTEDNVVMFGQLGEYYKDTERTIITKNAYVGYGTTDSLLVNNKTQPDSLWLGADTLKTEMVLQQTLTLIERPVIKAANELGDKDGKTNPAAPEVPSTPSASATPAKKNASVDPKAADTTAKKTPDIPVRVDSVAAQPRPVTPKLSKKELRQQEKEKRDQDKDQKKAQKIKNKTIVKATVDSLASKDASISRDSLALTPAGLLKSADTLKDKTAAQTKLVDSTKKVVVGASATAKKAAAKVIQKDSLMKNGKKFNPADTTRARIIQAHHNVKIYKTNMQAKADSLFYTSADSTFRWFRNPMLWSESSQQSGDTIYVQLKNKKLHNVRVIQNAFIVNVDTDSNKNPIDSTKFNQVKGKLITGLFEDGELKTMYVDGNAESIYFTKNNKGVIERMNQTISSRIKVSFKNKEMTNVRGIKDAEGVVYPIAEVTKEPILTGFIWKPELRPSSKLDVIGKGKKSTANPKTPTAKPATVKKPGTSTAGPAKQQPALNRR